MLRLVRKILFRRAPLKLAHPVFGDLELRQERIGRCWFRKAHRDDELTIEIEPVGEAPPTASQERFFEAVTQQTDDIYRLVSGEGETRHALFSREPVKLDWRQTFRLATVVVPIDGNRLLPWAVVFQCLTNGSGWQYICYFNHGATPVRVENRLRVGYVA